MIRNRIGSSKIIYLIIIATIVIGTIYFSNITLPSYMPENDDEISLGTVNAVYDEFQTPVDEINYMSEAIDDLQTLGCIIVNVSEAVQNTPTIMGLRLEYLEFRKLAYRQKIAFLFPSEITGDTPLLITAFEDFTAIWISKGNEPPEETTTSQGIMSLGPVNCEGHFITAYIRNIGDSIIEFDKAFIDGSLVPESDFDVDPVQLLPDQLAKIIIYSEVLTPPTTYEVKIVAKDNAQLTFNVKCKEIETQYTQFEKVEIQTAYSTRIMTGNTGWEISMELKNTGTAASTIIRAFVNDVPIDQADYSTSDIIAGATSCSFPYTGITIDSGGSMTLHIYISDSYKNLSSGTTINVKLHSIGGMDYIKLIELV